ncbi:MAG TPA: hypothetical protein VGB66_16190 [Longimicrobium sp.]|jgi:hypothetical protein
MSLLRFFRRDPTDGWPPCRAVPLQFDLARGALNGVPFGAPLPALRPLGRPSNAEPQPLNQYGFAPLGMEVVLNERGVSCFVCVFQPAGSEIDLGRYPGFAPCTLNLRLPGSAVHQFTPASVRADVERCLGPLQWQDLGAESIDSIVIGATWMGFGFDPEDRLAFVDLEPRAAYEDIDR